MKTDENELTARAEPEHAPSCGKLAPVDVVSGLRTAREELETFLGKSAWQLIVSRMSARCSEGQLHSALEEGRIPAGKGGVAEALALVGGRGYGSLRELEHDWENGWLLVESPDSLEAHIRLERDGPTDAPACDLLPGLLCGMYGYIRRRAGLGAEEIQAVEISCASQGHPACRFAVGSHAGLAAHGVEIHPLAAANLDELQEDLRRSRDSEARLRRFVEEMPFGVVQLDLEGRITFANRKALELQGGGLAKIKGTHFSEHVHPDDIEAVQEGFRRVVEGRADRYVVECRIVDADGEQHQCAVDAFPVHDDRGNVVGYQGVILDIRDRVGPGPRDQRFHAALRDGPKPYLELEPEGRIRHANEAALSLLDRPAEAVLGGPFTRFVAPEHAAAAYGVFLTVSSGRTGFASGEWELAGADGASPLVHFCLIADGGMNARTDRVLALLQDVSESGRTERALTELAHRHEALLASSEALVFETDKDGLLRRIEGPAEEILGYRPEELTGLSFPPYIHADDLPRAAEIMRRAATTPPGPPEEGDVAFRQPSPLSATCRVRRREGTWGTFRLTAAPALDGKGVPSAVVGLLRDVTQDAERAERLASRESAFAGLLESRSTWVVVCDAQGRTVALSRAYERDTGFDRSERLGRPLVALLAPGSDEVADGLCRARGSGESYPRLRLPFLRRGGGAPCVAELEPAAMRDLAGEHLGVMAVGRDVTEEVKREALEAERDELALEVAALRSEMKGRYGLDSIIGRDPKMRSIFETILAVSRTLATVLIQGETGTGKELVAKAIHYNSSRRDRPFVKVDCGALAENLLESELFGHVKGAFTGAIRERPGRFELADNGTIFLDEIHNLTVPLQAKLLRVVQEGRFEKVGSAKTREVDVRIIAATNENLEALVEHNGFRKDLYYRLNVIPIRLPSLKDRRGDIPVLVESFIQRFVERHEKEIAGISKEALDRLVEYDWPGNVRELENIVEQAVVFCRGKAIQAGDIRLPVSSVSAQVGLGFSSAPRSLKQALEDPERRILLEALARTGGNKKRAAELLGVSRSALYEKLKKHGLSARK